MDATVIFLISVGLCLHWELEAQLDTIFRPTLWAEPSPVVPEGADVTLRCQGQWASNGFQLWKDEQLKEERNATWQRAEFVLRNVNGRKDARSYRCRSGQGSRWSELSDPLTLVVTGAFTKPFISSSVSFPVPIWTIVTIQCQMSSQESSQYYNFALLEAKSLQVLQIQSSRRSQVSFSLPSLRVKDTGNYSCIYYTKTPPYRGSDPSQPLELTVSGQLPRPSLWAQPGLVVPPGTSITLWCLRPKMSFLEEVTFTLWKGWTLQYQNQTSVDLWTSFLFPSMRPEDTGSYRCQYKDSTASGRGSEYSDSLELVITGSLPKPSLSALPGLLVEPGKHVTLQCRQPPQSALWRATFILLKVGSPQPLQSQSSSGTSADFSLLSVTTQDAGNYTCVYYRKMVPYQASELSEVLEIWVTDAPPKPSLSAWPGPEIASGTNLSLLCQGPPWSTRFVLHKEGSMDIAQEEAQFFLTHVSSKHSGNYSCSYQLSINGSLWTQHSDPLQLRVRVSSNTLLITLSCVSCLLICFLLVVCFCHQSIPRAGFSGDSFRRFFSCPCLPQDVCLPHNVEDPREETLYTEMVKERPREPSVPKDKDPKEVTYAHLNIKTLNKKQTDPKEKSTETTLYATLSLD